MRLMTKAIEKTLPPLYSTEEVSGKDKMVYVKYFTPYSSWTWYGVEYDPKEKLFFGYVVGFEKAWGYFSLDEFEDMNNKGMLPVIERDLYFTPCKFSELGV